eukprot:TRINITY_DN28830_c0_g1_i1.p1 TRINITY_DN28830_c0_g1~~TRINITY_DN28830_c0_g1_i1.p1  ORF type:complete len:205 (+),score=60.78 TRINITY_DN28830_c0_g1_i1:69-617(+)
MSGEPKKTKVAGSMNAGKDDSDSSSSDDEGELEITAPAPVPQPSAAPSSAPSTAPPAKAPAKKDDDSDEDEPARPHLSQNHELNSLKLKLKPKGRGYRSGITHSVTRDMGFTSTSVASRPSTAGRPTSAASASRPGPAGVSTTGTATYGDDQWGTTSAPEYVGGVGGIRVKTAVAQKPAPLF